MVLGLIEKLGIKHHHYRHNNFYVNCTLSQVDKENKSADMHCELKKRERKERKHRNKKRSQSNSDSNSDSESKENLEKEKEIEKDLLNQDIQNVEGRRL